jgi:hypothetical protein
MGSSQGSDVALRLERARDQVDVKDVDPLGVGFE